MTTASTADFTPTEERASRRAEAESQIRVDDKQLKAGGQGAAVLAIIVSLALGLFSFLQFARAFVFDFGGLIWGLPLVIAIIILTMVRIQVPNQASVYTFFGNYLGTWSKPGLHVLPLPFTSRTSISLAQMNFESETLKINDERGNPLSVSAVVVYRIVRSASAVFSVHDYREYLSVQTEGALRHVISRYPYYSSDTTVATLLKDLDEVNEEILSEVANAVSIAGIEIVEARINNISYSVEIAQSMLQRQQAEAVLDARTVLVEGSVSIVQDALSQLEKDNSEFSPEAKTALVSNLLTVLVGDRSAQPVVNLS